ncbi:MAG: hypothetical protein IT546_15020 [Caulobacteraceae bacterium]|nr:hypothetical protein [Caulobacteraceae bacterium]
MSCDAIAAAAFLWLASSAPTPAPTQPAVVSVAQEPLFVDIVRRAAALKTEASAGAADMAGFKARIGELADLDMKGHITLRDRGGDGDLKCILKGISQDLPLKLAAIEGAGDAHARKLALDDMVYLLNDNVEVIEAPPAPPV